MLGLIFVYFVGKAFYELAGQHNRSQWGFAIIGVLSYYVPLYFAAFVIALIYEFSDRGREMNELVLTVAAIPFGGLACWGCYKFLQSRWKKVETPYTSGNILDAGLTGTDDKS